MKTEISWSDSTINPVMGCDGCELHRAGDKESHCYAAGLVGRYKGLPGWPASFDKPEMFLKRLDTALAWPDLTGKKRPDKPWLDGYPRLIFPCDLSDPFSESLPLGWLGPHLKRLADSPHIWIWLTKRPKRMAEFYRAVGTPKNFWLMTSVTSAATVARAADLLTIPDATVLGLSMEPLLGPVDLGHILWRDCEYNALTRGRDNDGGRLPHLDWVILGGESGPGARPMHPDWARSVRNQCVAAGGPFFFKQWGEWAPGYPMINRLSPNYGKVRQVSVQLAPESRNPCAKYERMTRVGKTAAGHLLDGKEWRQMPEVRR
jgi:protein gp37